MMSRDRPGDSGVLASVGLDAYIGEPSKPVQQEHRRSGAAACPKAHAGGAEAGAHEAGPGQEALGHDAYEEEDGRNDGHNAGLGQKSGDGAEEGREEEERAQEKPAAHLRGDSGPEPRGDLVPGIVDQAAHPQEEEKAHHASASGSAVSSPAGDCSGAATENPSVSWRWMAVGVPVSARRFGLVFRVLPFLADASWGGRTAPLGRTLRRFSPGTLFR